MIRLTQEIDLTTESGLKIAHDSVSDVSVPTLLFGAIPCTGGSTWTIVNLARCGPPTRRKIYKHRKIAYQLWRNFEESGASRMVV